MALEQWLQRHPEAGSSRTRPTLREGQPLQARLYILSTRIVAKTSILILQVNSGVLLYTSWYKFVSGAWSRFPSRSRKERRGDPKAVPSSASLGLTDYSQVDMLGVRYKSVSVGAEKSPVSPNWRAEIDRDRSVTLQKCAVVPWRARI